MEFLLLIINQMANWYDQTNAVFGSKTTFFKTVHGKLTLISGVQELISRNSMAQSPEITITF